MPDVRSTDEGKPDDKLNQDDHFVQVLTIINQQSLVYAAQLT